MLFFFLWHFSWGKFGQQVKSTGLQNQKEVRLTRLMKQQILNFSTKFSTVFFFFPIILEVFWHVRILDLNLWFLKYLDKINTWWKKKKKTNTVKAPMTRKGQRLFSHFQGQHMNGGANPSPLTILAFPKAIPVSISVFWFALESHQNHSYEHSNSPWFNWQWRFESSACKSHSYSLGHALHNWHKMSEYIW